jgi:putative glycosyltransferase (TIGR04372 family)
MKAVLKNVLRAIFIWVDHSASLLTTTGILCLNIRKIYNSNVIFYMEDGGYGLTITDVDIARRIFKDQNLTVIIASEVGRHNWKQAQIWPDINVMHVCKSIRYHDIEQTIRTKKYTKKILQLVIGTKNEGYSIGLTKPTASRHLLAREELFGLLIEKIKILQGEIAQSPGTPDLHIFYAYWFRSIELYDVKEPKIPEKWKNMIDDKLTSLGKASNKIATIYMRLKGVGTDGELRCGSGFESYTKAIDYLIELGFTILLVGDRGLDECPIADQKKYITATRLRVQKDCFNLYAATECDIFIGDPGGGAVLPSIMKVPRLMINSYPFSQVLPGYLQLFKRLVSKNHEDIPMKRCFEQLNYEFDPSIASDVRNNSADEIFEAVKELISVKTNSWFEYIKSELDGRQQPSDNAAHSRLGRLHLGPSRLVECQRRLIEFADGPRSE